MLDGTTLWGILQVPKYLREAIAAETEAYTLAQPPKFFGKASCKNKLYKFYLK